MRVPLEISWQGVDRSEAIEELIGKDVEKLERICDHLISCRIGLKRDQKRHHTANPFRIRIEIRVPPGRNLIVTHDSGLKEAADDLPAALKHAFKSADRLLRELVAKQQGGVKSHPRQETTALVATLFRDEGYGFLKSVDGEEIYFHRHSVLHDDFNRLEVGTGVTYTAEMGADGLQASTVQVVDKPGLRPRGGE